LLQTTELEDLKQWLVCAVKFTLKNLKKLILNLLETKQKIWGEEFISEMLAGT
jgi:hypothetical protein